MCKYTWMKHLGIVMLAGALGLSGCGGSAKSGTLTTTNASVSADTTTEAQAEMSDANEQSADGLPTDMPPAFVFSSGVGGWSTRLELLTDGSFSGSYSDTDMGDTGDDYPNGTMYVCNFIGQFVDIQKTGEHTYEMTLEGTQTEDIDEEIIDGVHRVPSTPYGIADGKTFILYTPDTPLDEIPEALENWDPYRFNEDGDSRTTLGAYALYNEATGDGFFSYTE